MRCVSPLDTSAYFDQERKLYRRFWDRGLSFADYVAGVEERRRERWNRMYERVALTGAQRSLVASFTREMKVLTVSATWCGDCIGQVPILARIAEASAKVELRLVERDEHPELRDSVRICGAAKVPVALFLSEDYFECGRSGDRTLATYRAMAAKQLGPACPLGGEVEEDELQAGIKEWLDQFERIQLMLRLSPYLRERYED